MKKLVQRSATVYSAVFKPFALLSLVVFIFIGCKKDTTPAPEEKFEQYFKSTIDNHQVSLSSKDFKNRDFSGILNGQYTIRGFEAYNIEEYNIQVRIPKAASEDVFQTLRFTIHDIQTGSFHINGESTIYDENGSFVTFREAASNVIFYKSNRGGAPSLDPEIIRYISLAEKEPFEIIIDKYEFIEGSSIPAVGGRLNGILYNTENAQDSVIIKDGSFNVHY